MTSRPRPQADTGEPDARCMGGKSVTWPSLYAGLIRERVS